MRYDYGYISFRGSIPEIKRKLREYLSHETVHLEVDQIRLGLETLTLPTTIESLDDIREPLIQAALSRVEQSTPTLQYMGKKYYGNWDDVFHSLKPVLKALPLMYRADGYFMLGLLSVFINEDLPITKIKEKLVTKIMCHCRDQYHEKYKNENI